MNCNNKVFLLLMFFVSVLQAGTHYDYTNIVKTSRKKQTSVSQLYQQVIGDYRQGVLANEKLKNANNDLENDQEDIRSQPMTKEDRLRVGVAKIVDLTFEQLEKQDTGSLVLETPEEKDILPSLTPKAYQELRLVPVNGKGLVYNLPTATVAGTAVSLRYLIDPHVSKEDIDAKQFLQQRFMDNQGFRHSVQSQVDIIAKQGFEKKILDAFIRCAKDKNTDPKDVLESINIIEEYIGVVSAMHAILAKDKEFDGKKILFTRYLDICSHELFKKFQVLLEEYRKEASGSFRFSYPKANAMEAFLRNGKIFTEVLFPSMTAYGVCDLFLTTTRVLSPGTQNSQYNYAKVVKSDRPFVKATNVCHPNVQSPIPINFEFQRTDSVVGVVTTGPNGSGKSYGLRQIFANVALAVRPYGLIRGNLEISPVDYIDVHANVSDSDEISKFMHEGGLFKKLIDTMTKLSQDKKIWVFFDEQFSSTGSKEAYQLLATNARFLLQNPSIIAFYVTHCRELADIKELVPWRTKIIKNIDGTSKSLYQLEPGKSDDYNGIVEISKAGGPGWVALHKKYFGDVLNNENKKQESVNSVDSTVAVTQEA